MKKLYVIILIFYIVLLTACSKEARQMQGFLSDNEGTYGLYVVEDEQFDSNALTQDGIDVTKIHLIYHPISFEVAKEQMSTLELEKAPAYLVFDNKGLIIKTYKYEELTEFLKNRIAQK